MKKYLDLGTRIKKRILQYDGEIHIELTERTSFKFRERNSTQKQE